MVAGDITRRILVKRFGMSGFAKIKPHLSSVSSLGVVLIIFVAMSLKATRSLTNRPPQ